MWHSSNGSVRCRPPANTIAHDHNEVDAASATVKIRGCFAHRGSRHQAALQCLVRRPNGYKLATPRHAADQANWRKREFVDVLGAGEFCGVFTREVKARSPDKKRGAKAFQDIQTWPHYASVRAHLCHHCGLGDRLLAAGGGGHWRGSIPHLTSLGADKNKPGPPQNYPQPATHFVSCIQTAL